MIQRPVILLALCVFARFTALPIFAADPAPAAFGPVRLELQLTAPPPPTEIDPRFGTVLLPFGPVRFDYKISRQVRFDYSTSRLDYRLLDAPGAGYREQRARVHGQ